MPSTRFNELCYKVLTGTCSATPGTRTNHAHGLGYAPLASAVLIVPTAPDNNTDNAGAVAIVTADATNITVKSNKASATFRAFIFLDRDVGGVNNLV